MGAVHTPVTLCFVVASAVSHQLTVIRLLSAAWGHVQDKSALWERVQELDQAATASFNSSTVSKRDKKKGRR